MSNGRRQIPTLAAVILALAARHVGAEPPELRLLSAASMQTVFKDVIADFERRSGYQVSLRYSTMGAIITRVMAGETADLIISSPASIAALAAGGKVHPGSEVTIARTGIGIVVPAGDGAPTIASIEDFKDALLAARVVVYANPAGGGAAGRSGERRVGKERRCRRSPYT